MTRRPFALLQAGNTAGVFQLESDGMRALMVRLKPTTFEDIIALVALYRPGPMESGMHRGLCAPQAWRGIGDVSPPRAWSRFCRKPMGSSSTRSR